MRAISLVYGNPHWNGSATVDIRAVDSTDNRIVHSDPAVNLLDRRHMQEFGELVALNMNEPDVADQIREEIENWARNNGVCSPILSAGELVDRHPHERAAIIEGWLRAGEVLNIVAAPKTYKSHLAMMIALCVGVGRPILDMFTTQKSRVLLIDNECFKETVASRIRSVASALGIIGDEWRTQLNVLSLRGSLKTIDQLVTIARTLPKNKYGLIIIDAMYRAWPEGCDESSNSDVTRAYNTLDRLAEITGAAIIVVHHTSKGAQGNKSVTDTGSGAGSQSRAADGHIVIREHEENGCAVVSAVFRSWAPIEPLGIRWRWPRWQLDPTLDVTKLKRDPGKGGRPRKGGAGAAAKPAEEPWSPERFAAEFVTANPQTEAAIKSRAARSGLQQRLITGLIAEAEQSRMIFLHPKRPGSNAKVYANQEPARTETVSLSRAQPP